MSDESEPGAAEAIVSVLARLAARTPELDRLDDEIGGLIGRVEVALRSLRLGMLLRVPILDDGDRWQSLTFEKVNGTWRLVVNSGLWGESDIDEKPLSDCDRETRLAAFRDGTIEKLLLSAGDQLEEAIKEREAALRSGRRFIDVVESVATRRGTK